MNENPTSRRRFLVQAAVAASALPLLARMASQPAQASLPKLPLDNAQAKALGYVEDASTTKNAAYKPGSKCSNCQFHQPATGGCALFNGYSVSADGWCSAWAKKA